jgi:hypothetical protein
MKVFDHPGQWDRQLEVQSLLLGKGQAIPNIRKNTDYKTLKFL